MGDLGPEKGKEAAVAGSDLGHVGLAGDNQNSLHDKLSADSQLSKSSPGDSSQQKSASSDSQFLPAFDVGALALWGSAPSNDTAGADKSSAGSWSDRYAANFDRSDEDKAAAQKLDMSHAVGLPRGASTEELLRATKRQEEDLLKQLLEA